MKNILIAEEALDQFLERYFLNSMIKITSKTIAF